MNYATYCPEDDKLRLYVGRVPRDEYEKLRSEGWTSTPKQDCNFMAVWSVARENTALEYSNGVIEDEDTDPTERAADRAERFAGYRDRREGEAYQLADSYDSGPAVHGYQSQALAERRAGTHDRIATRATNQWDKAEYWQQRTAGVITHALHKQSPGVRMGRIKTIEKDLRAAEQRYCVSDIEKSPHSRYMNHLKLRLAYENQMLEEQGGRLAHVEMEPGGFLGDAQIITVAKSPATGRVTSVKVKVPKKEGWDYRKRKVAGADYDLLLIETERLKPELYRAPTPEEKTAFEEWKKEDRKARSDQAPKQPPFINPTLEDAQKLQAVWNEAQKNSFGSESKEVIEMTQAQYSAGSKGSYARMGTCFIVGGGRKRYNSRHFDYPVVAKIRCRYDQVIVITDKPQKPLTKEMWHSLQDDYIESVKENWDLLDRYLKADWIQRDRLPPEEKSVFKKACTCGIAFGQSASQQGLTEAGYKIKHEMEARAKELTQGVLL